jgi:arylsulfatase A
VNRRDFLKQIAAAAGGLSFGGSLASGGAVLSNKAVDIRTPTKKTNVVLILADDLGYADIGCYQTPGDPKYIDTSVLNFSPNIDALAAGGVRFTDFHAYPVCTPTRFVLLSGMYLRRSSSLWNIGVLQQNDTNKGIDRHTMAESFKAAGYATACIGKWHLGSGTMLQNGYPSAPPFSTTNNYHPDVKGFDYYYGHLGGSIDYCNHSNKDMFFDWFDGRQMLWNDDGSGDNIHADENKYSTHLITDGAIDFINTNADKPFFLYVPYNAPHWAQTKIQDSLHVSQLPVEEETVGHPDYRKYLSRFDGYNDGTTTWGVGDDNTNWRKRFLAMVNIMDDGIGKIMQTLRSKGLEDNTIVVFISDNGGETLYNYGTPVEFGSKNYPLRDDKGGVYEGGIRVPAIFQWKGHIPAGQTSAQLASVVDMKLTVGRLAGLDMDSLPTDGIDLRSNLQNPGTTIPRPDGLFMYHSNKYCYRKNEGSDKWKYVKHADGTEALYNLANDIHEDTNLKTANVTKYNELKNEYLNKYNNVITPGSVPPLPPPA